MMQQDYCFIDNPKVMHHVVLSPPGSTIERSKALISWKLDRDQQAMF